MSYLDLDPGAVQSAGRRTAMTASDWASWASRSEARLREAGGGARSSKVQAGFGRFLSRHRPAIRRLADDASALGNNATSAAATVAGADHDGSVLLRAPTLAAQQQATVLSRPVNAGR